MKIVLNIARSLKSTTPTMEGGPKEFGGTKAFKPLVQRQAGRRVDITDHWSIIDHFAKMVDVLEFVVDIT